MSSNYSYFRTGRPAPICALTVDGLAISSKARQDRGSGQKRIQPESRRSSLDLGRRHPNAAALFTHAVTSGPLDRERLPQLPQIIDVEPEMCVASLRFSTSPGRKEHHGARNPRRRNLWRSWWSLLAAMTWAKARSTANFVEGAQYAATSSVVSSAGGGSLDLPMSAPPLW